MWGVWGEYCTVSFSIPYGKRGIPARARRSRLNNGISTRQDDGNRLHGGHRHSRGRSKDLNKRLSSRDLANAYCVLTVYSTLQGSVDATRLCNPPGFGYYSPSSISFFLSSHLRSSLRLFSLSLSGCWIWSFSLWSIDGPICCSFVVPPIVAPNRLPSNLL